MADVAIKSTVTTAAPEDYRIPGAQELFLKAVHAVFDGTNASGAYLPCLQLLSPDGIVMWTAFPGSTVAAGASADVSWFPDVSPGSGTDIDTGITTLTSSGATIAITTPSGPTTNVDLPVSGVTGGTYGDASDVAQVTVNAQGIVTNAASVSIVGGGVVVGSDGWINDTAETWTFASFAAGPPAVGTFTVSGDVRSKYTVGTRIKLVQTTTKYFVVSADPTFGGGVTTVTISGGTDYTLANAAISGNYHSYVLNPQGYPTWFNYAPGAAGWSAPTVNVARFAVEGRTCLVNVDIQGTSNATTATAVAPIAGGASSSESGVAMLVTENNTVIATTPGRAVVGASSTTMTFNSNMAGAGWTNSGTKRATCQMAYEI